MKPVDKACSFCLYLVASLPDDTARKDLCSLGRGEQNAARGGKVRLRYELCIENELYTDEDVEYPPYTLDISFISKEFEVLLHFPSLTLIDSSSILSCSYI